MECNIRAQDDILRIRDGEEPHGMLIDNEGNYWKLEKIMRDVEYLEDAVLVFKPVTEDFLTPIIPVPHTNPDNWIKKENQKKLFNWFKEQISQLLPKMIFKSMTLETIEEIIQALKKGEKAKIVSGAVLGEGETSHIQIENKIYGI